MVNNSAFYRRDITEGKSGLPLTLTLTVVNVKQTFDTDDGETMLDALLRNGVRVRYGCRRGKCATCKHYIKGVDLTRLGLAVPLVDEIAAAPLDVWAHEHGYTKIELNLVGL